MAMTRVDWIVLNYGVSQVLTIIHTGVFAYVLLQYDTTASHWCICALYITFKTTSWISCHGSYVTWCNVTWHNVSKLFRWMGLLCPLGIYLSRNSSCSVLVFQSKLFPTAEHLLFGQLTLNPAESFCIRLCVEATSNGSVTGVACWHDDKTLGVKQTLGAEAPPPKPYDAAL